MKIIRNIQLEGQHGKPILTDVYYTDTKQPKHVVIFAHGYKGYKDWGCWDLIARQFANENFVFIKFNFSHNGGTVEQPIDFPDLEAFGNNNYSKELDDLQSVIDWVFDSDALPENANTSNLTLIGHSRGGGIVTIKASEENKITNLITWAAVSNFGNRSSTVGDLEQWKKDGVKYIVNGRTKQQMPHYYQFYEDFKANENRLTIERAAKAIEIPFLIIHGTEDTSILVQEAQQLHTWNQGSELVLIHEANHTFNSKHPWEANDLPKNLQNVVSSSIDFIKNATN